MKFPAINNIRRAGTGAIGPLSFAGGNFLLAMLVQQRCSAGEFGLYVFSQMLIGAGQGISNGLLGNPLIVEIARHQDQAAEVIRSFSIANAIFCAVGVLGLALLISLLEGSPTFTLLVTLQGGAMLVRWFLRSLELAQGKRLIAIRMDILYGCAVSASLLLFLAAEVSLGSVLVIQGAAAIISLVPAWESIKTVLSRGEGTTLVAFRRAFKLHGRWATFGVVATQMAANSHAYALTLMLGAGAFAPIALANLLFRPLGVILTGLVQHEQPRMAGRVTKHLFKELASDERFMRYLVTALWFLNVCVVVAIFFGQPSRLVKEGYETNIVGLALLLTSVVVLFRSLREPKMAALQAAGHFKTLALITASCGPVSALVSIAVVLMAPELFVYSLVGPIIGEVINLVLVTSAYKMFINNMAKLGA